jgi:hypothetical protein
MFIEIFLTPFVPTKKALRLMNTNYFSALGAGPPFLFVSNEQSYAEFPYVLEVFNHTHTILFSIALIQVVQPSARKDFTTEAIFNASFHYRLTVFDLARGTGFRFETIVTSATRACLFISNICATEATVHSTWSNQHRANCICLCRSSCHHVCIPDEACIGAAVLKPNILFI